MRWQAANGQVVTTEEFLAAYARLNPTSHSDCDALFQNYGPGNRTSTTDPLMHLIDRPYERLAIYEHMLHESQIRDSAKYGSMHKGTPYFFISWLSFTVKDFEKAIFYMDSALSEDIRAASLTPTPDIWQNTPAARFLFLDSNQPDVAARSIMARIESEFQQQLTRFNTNSGANLTLVQYRNNFVNTNIQDNSFRAIISGLYVFIMEHVDREYMIRLKSNQGGSIEPFLIHLFKGCLIFESLLKTEYGSTTNNTLGRYLSATNARSDLEIGLGSRDPVYHRDQPTGGYTLPGTLTLLPTWRTEGYQERIIAIVYAIRNTAGHDLSWPITFDESTYQEIYEALIESIFWFIWKVKI